MTNSTKLLRITGVVQGVGCRASLAAQAENFKLSGWVRNRRDGSVEALVQGETNSVLQLIEWARRGPPGARVSDVVVTESNEIIDPGFQILSTT